MKTIETNALVVKSLNYGESDKIVTIFSEDLGRVKGVAKGARRSLKRFGGCLEPFALVRFTYKPGKDLGRFEEGTVVRNFRAIKEDLLKMAYGSYLLELAEALFAEGEGGQDAYGLLLDAFADLSEEGRESEAVVRGAEVRLLGLTGYMPSFTTCVVCSDPITAEKHRDGVAFSGARGGVVCAGCHPKGERVDFVSPGTLKTLSASAGRRVLFTKHALEESGRIIPAFITHHLGKPLKSLDFIDQMKGVV